MSFNVLFGPIRKLFSSCKISSPASPLYVSTGTSNWLASRYTNPKVSWGEPARKRQAALLN